MRSSVECCYPTVMVCHIPPKDSHSSLRKDTKVKSFPSQTRNEGEPINVALKKIAMGGLGQTAVQQQCSGALMVAAPRNG
eukprot:COSAG01_NODE_62_length_29700_cov_146.810615_3_plen_80_part_00